MEPVVRAILASTVPIISAVGHEQDHLVSDLVADVRASTPSNAIERLVPERHAIVQLLDEFDLRIKGAMQRRLQEWRQHLALLTSQLRHAPGKGIYAAKERLSRLNHRMQRSMEATVSGRQQRLAQLEATLNAAHPKRVLERGYSMFQDDQGAVISDVANLKEGQTIQLQFADGQAAADVHSIEPLEDER